MSLGAILFCFCVSEVVLTVLSLIYRSIDQSLPNNPYDTAAKFVSNRVLNTILWAVLAYYIFQTRL